jgi:hypothetical protein
VPVAVLGAVELEGKVMVCGGILGVVSVTGACVGVAGEGEWLGVSVVGVCETGAGCGMGGGVGMGDGTVSNEGWGMGGVLGPTRKFSVRVTR